MSDSGKYSGFGYPDIRVPVEITNFNLCFAVPKKVNDLPDDVHSATTLLIQKEVENQNLYKSIPTLVSGFSLVFFCGVDPFYVLDYTIMDFCCSV